MKITQTEIYTEYEYQVHRVIRLSGSDQEIVLKRQSHDVIIVEGTPCEIRGLRDEEIVSTEISSEVSSKISSEENLSASE